MIDINLQDCVQLTHGHTTKMNVSAINAEAKTAMCIYWDTVKRVYVTVDLPLNVLSKCPDPITADDLMKAFRR